MATLYRRPVCLIAACGLAALMAASSAWAGSADSSEASTSSGPAHGLQLALFGFGKSDSDATPKPPRAPKKQPLQCPKVSVQPGTAAHIVYERGRDGDPTGVKYQVRFSEFARECIDFGAEAGIRVGIAARALVGPLGKGGAALDVPVRFVVLDKDRNVVVSRVTRLRIEIPAGTNGITFTHVEEMGVPMPPDRLKDWDFRVGFDTKPGGAQG